MFLGGFRQILSTLIASRCVGLWDRSSSLNMPRALAAAAVPSPSLHDRLSVNLLPIDRHVGNSNATNVRFHVSLAIFHE